ncbi:MAG: hypothetical protein QFB86_01640 [Patescibacteria group bacterium]|nr:hypothetical protein [Patescibacteria group bacterium]
MQSTSSVRTFRPNSPGEPKKPSDKKTSKVRTPRKFPKLSAQNAPWMITAVVIIFAAFMFAQYRQATNKLYSGSQAVSEQQTLDTVQRVGKLILLPKDQTPTVATVKHADQLKNQAFFKQAKDGDKVLVYSKTKQAILYRPSTNQLIAVSTVTVDPSSSSSAQ